jgi:hypothetical protein
LLLFTASIIAFIASPGDAKIFCFAFAAGAADAGVNNAVATFVRHL